MFPLLKTGGLADVIGALPAAQIAEGIDTRVLLPAFPDIRRGVTDAQVVTRRDTFAGRMTLLFGHYNGVGIYLIDAPHLYDRPGSPYHDTNQHAYTDNVLRFALLGWVGSEMARLACRAYYFLSGLAWTTGEIGLYGTQSGLSGDVLLLAHE